MKFRKLLSGVLACALAVTSVFAGNVSTVKAEGSVAEPTAKVVSPDTPMAYYDFDADTLHDDFTIIGEKNAASNATPSYGEGRTIKEGDKSIKLGDYALRLDGNIGENYTVSVWVKSNKKKISNNGAIFLLGAAAPEDWLGFAGRDKDNKAKLWSKSDTAEGSHTTYSHTGIIDDLNMTQGVWTMLTLAQEGNELSVYQDGVPLNVDREGDNMAKVLKGENMKILLGATYWGDGVFDGWMDDIRIYDKKLSAEEVKDLYRKDVTKQAEAEIEKNGIIQTAEELSVGIGETETIKLKDYIPDFLKDKFSYVSEDAETASVNASGEIKGLKAGTTKVTATYKNGAFELSRDIKVTVKDTKQELTPVSSYTFGTDSGELQGASPVTTNFGKYEGDVEYGDGRSGKAINIKSAYGLQLKETNLGSNYTVSMWVKNTSFSARNKVLLFIGNSANWVGLNSHDNGYKDGACKFWSMGRTSGYDYPVGLTNADVKVPNNEWTMVTVSQAGTKASLYLNGKQIAAMEGATDVAEAICEAMNGEEQRIGLGVNPWSGDKLENALMDDVHVYDTALDEAQVTSIYLQEATSDEMFKSLDILNGNNLNKVTEDLKLPAKFSGSDLVWTSDAPTKLSNEGKVLVKDGSKVTLTVNASIPEYEVTREEKYDVTLAKTVTIKHVDEKGGVLKTETVDWQMGEEYAYTVEEEDKILSSKTAAYIYDETVNTEQTLKIDAVSVTDDTVTIVYNTVNISSVDKSKLPTTVYVIDGNKPILPKTLKGTIMLTPDDGQESSVSAQDDTETPEPINIPIIWDDYSEWEPSNQDYTLNGNVAGHEISVKLHIFACDEAVADTAASGEDNAKTKFKNGYRGVIETEYDIVITGTVGDDPAIEYYDKGRANGLNWWCATSTRFTGNKFFVNGGNGLGGGASASGSKDYPAEADRTFAHDGSSIYHVRTRIDTTNVSVTAGTPEVVNSNGTYRVWVTDPQAHTEEITNPEEPMTSRAIQTGIIDRVGVSKSGFKIINHKISWQSGYVTKKIEVYVDGDEDDTRGESYKVLPSQYLSDEVAEGADASERAKAYAYKPKASFELDGEECVFDAQKSGWYKADGTTKIEDPAATDVAVADATIIYKAYYKKGAANFAGLKEEIDDATKVHIAKTAEKIYKAASLSALKNAIDAAQEVYDTQGKDDEADKQKVEDAISALNTAKKAEMDLKDFAEMNGELTAYYPMTEDVNDTIGETAEEKYNGTVTGNVAFTKENGATFPGGEALKNYIDLPTNIPVTNAMTFSFWVYDQAGGANTFGMGSGKKLSNGSALNNSTTAAHHFSICVRGTGKLRAGGGDNGWGGNIKEVLDVTVDYSKWNLVTCVLSGKDGKDLTIYLNGEYAKAGSTGVSLTQAWNANAEERYIFIGNNIYGGNGDADFKGSIKNFRIYNASLAAQQVKDIYDNETELLLDNAAEILAVNNMGAIAGTGANAGKYTKLITTNDKLNLPKTGAQKAAITWKSYGADGAESNAVINAQDGTVTLPNEGQTSTATLKATLSLNGKTKEVEILCTVTKLSTAVEEARKDLQKAVNDAKALSQSNYTSSSWSSFKTILDASETLLNDSAATEDAITTQTERLKTAMKTDGTGTLVLRGDKTALNTLVNDAKNAMTKAEPNKSEYEEAVWNRLDAAIKAAEQLSDDVDAAAVKEKQDELQAALDAFKPKAANVSKEEADKLAEDADKLLEGKNEYEYDEKVWADMQEALAAVKALTAESTQEEVNAAYNKLQEAMDAFLPKKIDSAALASLATDTKKELEGLNRDDYDPQAWAAVEEALKAVEDLSDDATEEAIKAAYERLWKAVRTLKASPYVQLKEISLDQKSLTLSIPTKKTATLELTINPENASDQTATWSSSNDKVATVSQSGMVTAKAKGTTTITVKVGDKTATCKVTVKSLVTKVALSAPSKQIAAGKKVTVKAAITPSAASSKKVTWKSSNTKWATVKNGVVTTKKAGAGKTVTITATAADGSKKNAKIKITIMKNAVTKVTLKAAKKSVKAGKSVNIKATVKTNGKKANKTLTWKSSNTKFATVNAKGKVTTKKAGKGKTVTITATATDGTGKKASVKIKITK